MNINDINVPDNLMSNVEKKLRNHMKVKDKRRNIFTALLVIVLALITPASVLAYRNYVKNIPYSQEIDLARQKNAITKLNTSFKYKGVQFKFKEAIADETGLVVLYDVSDPKYSINKVDMVKEDGSKFSELGVFIPEKDDDENEKAFYTSVEGDSIGYMKKNPVIIKIDGINNSSAKNDIHVNWSLKLQVPVYDVKTIAINKEQTMDIGTIKFKSLNMGVLKTYIDYEFIPSDKNIAEFSPIFSFRIDKEYLDSIHDYTNGANFSSNGPEFKSVYYSNPKEIGIRVIGGTAYYTNEGKEYIINKSKIPMDFEFNGEKGRINSMKESKGFTEYSFEFDKDNRSYAHILPEFIKATDFTETGEKVKFKNQAEINNLYDNLLKVIPDFKQIYIDSKLDQAVTKIQVKVPNEYSGSFKIYSVGKSMLLNLDEVVIKP